MAIGGSTCGTKIGGNSQAEADTNMIGGGKKKGAINKKIVKRVAKRVVKSVVKKGGDSPGDLVGVKSLGGAKKVVKRGVKKVVKKVVKRKGGEGPDSMMEETPHPVAEKMGVEPKISGGAKKIPKKKRVLHPYNKFVKKQFPKMKQENPNYTATQIMKKLAVEWDKQKKQK